MLLVMSMCATLCGDGVQSAQCTRLLQSVSQVRYSYLHILDNTWDIVEPRADKARGASFSTRYQEYNESAGLRRLAANSLPEALSKHLYRLARNATTGVKVRSRAVTIVALTHLSTLVEAPLCPTSLSSV